MQKPWQKIIVNIFIFLSVCLATIGFLFCCAAFLIVKIDTPEYVLVPLTTGLMTFACFLDSFLLSKLFKENGMIIGLAAAAISILLIVSSALIYGTFTLSNIFLTKVFAIILAGALGGILGVNAA
ncbi:MAG: TIGR04086 family membrane protein [Oscillospiraceae bacterium]